MTAYEIMFEGQLLTQSLLAFFRIINACEAPAYRYEPPIWCAENPQFWVVELGKRNKTSRGSKVLTIGDWEVRQRNVAQRNDATRLLFEGYLAAAEKLLLWSEQSWTRDAT